MHTPGTPETKVNALISTYLCMHTPGTPEDLSECSGLHLTLHAHSRYSRDQGECSGLHLPLHAQSSYSRGPEWMLWSPLTTACTLQVLQSRVPRWMLWSPPTTACTLQVLQRTKVNALVSTFHSVTTSDTPRSRRMLWSPPITTSGPRWMFWSPSTTASVLTVLLSFRAHQNLAWKVDYALFITNRPDRQGFQIS